MSVDLSIVGFGGRLLKISGKKVLRGVKDGISKLPLVTGSWTDVVKRATIHLCGY